jgi:hypothetical protein
MVVDEATARRVLLVHAVESGMGADDGLWTADDARWASRLARESLPADAPAQAFVTERTRHALQRLKARDAGLAALAEGRPRRTWWRLAAAVLLGLVAGTAADLFAGGRHVDLLAPAVWAVVAWNVVVYALLLVATPLRRPRRLVAGLARRLAGASAAGRSGARGRFHGAWLAQASPLLRARAAVLLHTAAAALALGLMLGLYLRGLVLDYRAGWQSTFLDAAQVQGFLQLALAPAVAATGIAIPDVSAIDALRVTPAAPAQASAAPWIHLFAAQLGLLVVLPRALLALGAALRAGWRSRRFALPLHEPGLQRLLHEHAGRGARVQVLGHGAVSSPHVLECLRRLLAQAAYGDDLRLDPQAHAVAWGDEAAAGAVNLAPGTTLRVVLVDLGATPEDEAHGALLDAAARPGVPLLLLADEAAFRRRFAASAPARVAERRAAWAAWAQGRGIAFASADLAEPDLVRATRELQAALR